MCVLLACCVPSLLVEVEKFKTMASTSVTAKEDVEAKYEVATNARAVAEAKVEEMLGRLSALSPTHPPTHIHVHPSTQIHAHAPAGQGMHRDGTVALPA